MEKIVAGYTRATILESLHLIKRVIVFLIPCMHLKFLISKLMSPVISEIIITWALGTYLNRDYYDRDKVVGLG